MEILTGMRQTLELLKKEEPSYAKPLEILRRHTSVVDDLILELHQQLAIASEPAGMALVAVGGYGRRELTPWSDMDLMFLCQDTSSREMVQTIHQVLHTLWDLRLEVGHSVRNVGDCIDVSLKDLRTWTALMDARFLAGDRDLFGSFQKRMDGDLFLARREEFVRRLVQGVWERHRKYSRTPFLVEPHLKEGPGGLRDVQSALWLARSRFPVHDLEGLVDHAVVSRDEAEEIQRAHEFLLVVRLALHRLAGKKEDQLTFGIQERLSQEVPLDGIQATPQVETFMQQFYRHTTRIRNFVEDVIQKATDPSLASGPQGPTHFPEELGEKFLVVRGRLTLLDDRAFEMDPPRMMEVLALTHREGIDLDIFTRDQIKASLHLVDGKFQRSRRARDAFLSLLDTPDCGSKALELMHRLGLLQAYIPEFNRICFQVQHDAYHAYTVDFHSLEAVGELARIRRAITKRERGVSVKILREIKDWPPLVLAVLLHDIGKGEGSGHAQRGAILAEALLKRWRLARDDRERVVFLIGEHLLLMDTALGRDLTDEKVIADFSRIVGSVDRLNDLYLLTLADMKATAPDLLTDWKDQLLRELYLKARRLLETGELVSPEAAQRIKEAREHLVAGLKDVIEGKELESWIQSLPGRYLLTTPPENLVGQVHMARLMVDAGETLRMDHRSGEGYQEISICTHDAPALFSRICGVLVAHGFNILGARIHTWTNGIVMDTFQVQPLEGEEPIDAVQLDRVGRDLAAVLEGRADLDRLLSRRAPSPYVTTDRHPAIPPRVRIDNNSSDFFTILEVRARDRFGLLFGVTRTLSELDLDIHLALIDTRRGQVFDVFYVQEFTGQKVWDEERLALVERELHRALERMEG